MISKKSKQLSPIEKVIATDIEDFEQFTASIRDTELEPATQPTIWHHFLGAFGIHLHSYSQWQMTGKQYRDKCFVQLRVCVVCRLVQRGGHHWYCDD